MMQRPISSADCPVDSLEWYVNHTLAADDQALIEVHLEQCAACRLRVEEISAIRSALHRAVALTPTPRSDLFALIESRRDEPSPRVRRWRERREEAAFLWQLLRVQLRLIRRDLWSSSLVVLILGWVVSYLLSTTRSQPSGAVLAAIAPLIAALGLSVIYGKESDSALELTMTAPTSPQQVLLVRFVLVFGYNCGLMLLLSGLFKLIVPAVDLSTLLALWLGPLFFLGSMALALSLAVNLNAAVIGSLIVWVLRVMALTDLGSQPRFITFETLTAFWSNTTVLLLLTALFLTVGFVLVNKKERFL